MNQPDGTPCPICAREAEALFVLGSRHFHRCRGRGCGLTFVSPQPSNAELQHFYNEDYFNDTKPATGLTDDIVGRQIVSKMIERSGTPDPVILDYGCARGSLWTVLPPGLKNRYFGIELDPNARADAAAATGRPIYRTIEEFKAGAGTRWDLCMMINVIEHLRDPVHALTRLAATGTPGGLIWVSTPNDNCLKRYLVGHRWEQYADRTHIELFSFKVLSDVLRRAGLSRIRRLRFRFRYSHLGLLRTAAQVLTRPLGLDANLSVVAALPQLAQGSREGCVAASAAMTECVR
jgi:hypothetical protein